MRDVRVELGQFACDAVRETVGGDLREAVRAAVLRHIRKLERGERPLPPPPFRATEPAIQAGSFDLPLASEVEARLEEEADRHGVPVQQIALQALLAYLAEIDCGAIEAGVTDPAPFGRF